MSNSTHIQHPASSIQQSSPDIGLQTSIIKIGIINISDRASKGIYEDIPGKEIVKTLNEFIVGSWEKEYAVIPDEQGQIENTLIDMADNKNCCLVVTSGGTGPSPRDVTPEATEKVCQKMMPGFGELMRSVSLQYVPTAILSRQTAGIRNKTLIVNLPGKPKAIRQCLEVVFPAIPYCIDLIGGPFITGNESVIKVFRPKS
jgi:molybdopterin adenylyltransferase